LKGKVNDSIWGEIHSWIGEHVDLDTVHQIFATGGNINKVHKMLGAQHMETISTLKMKQLREEINSLTIDQRVEKFQLKPDRADVIVPAMDIYIYIMKELKCKNIIVPKIGLSDGMIYDMYLKRDN